MKIVYILAPYPTVATSKDGMVQRIAIVDDLLSNYKKIYINIALKNPVFKIIIHTARIEEYFLNPFYPIFIISKFLLKAEVIYAHSIYLFRFMPYCFFWIKKRSIKLILDAHGVVPEEVKMNGKPLMSNYFSWIENKVFKVLKHCICVSNEMAKHYQRKYPYSLVKYHLLFTGKLMLKPNIADTNKLAEILKIKATHTVVLYCGNTQVWQNVPLMIQTFEKLNSGKTKFIILTGETDKFERMLRLTGVNTANIVLKSVPHSELNSYYELAHYGLILRDDLPINRVSNPTKMLEYLQFGLIPIVLCPFIGDYYSMGYEYISINDIENMDFTPRKSLKNTEVAKAITSNNELFDMEKLID